MESPLRERPSTASKRRAAKSPVVQRFAANSPYKKPIVFMRKQIVRNQVQEAILEDELKRLRINHELTTRLLSEDEYNRLYTKTHVRKKEEIQQQIVVPRWPEVRKHIPGVETWRPASPKPSDYRQGGMGYYESYDSEDYYEDDDGNVYYDEYGNARYAPGGQFDEGQSMQDYNRLESNQADFSLYQGPQSSKTPTKSNQRTNKSSSRKKSASHSRDAAVYPTSPGEDEEGEDVPTFDLTEAEVQAILKIRSSLAKAIASIPDGDSVNRSSTGSKLPVLKEKGLRIQSDNLDQDVNTLTYFSPNSQQQQQQKARVDYQPALHYNADQQAMFQYANTSNERPTSPPPHTHESLHQPQHHHHQPLQPITPMKSPESIHSGSEVNKVLPEVRMSPLEMKYYREQQTMRPSSGNKKSSNKPHPSIKGQYQTPQYQKSKAKVDDSPVDNWRKSLDAQFAASPAKPNNHNNNQQQHKAKEQVHSNTATFTVDKNKASSTNNKPITSPKNKQNTKHQQQPQSPPKPQQQEQPAGSTPSSPPKQSEQPSSATLPPTVTATATATAVDQQQADTPIATTTNAATPVITEQDTTALLTTQPDSRSQQVTNTQPPVEATNPTTPRQEERREITEDESPRRSPNRASLRGSRIRQENNGSILKAEIANALAGIKIDSSSQDAQQNDASLPHVEVEATEAEEIPSSSVATKPHPLFGKKADGSGGGMFNPSMLTEMKQKKLKKVPKGDKKKAEELTVEETEEKLAQRYTLFRHNMLLHHISEFSTERFVKTSVLGRGKYAAVYQGDTNPPVVIDAQDNTAVFMKTVFRCLKSDDADFEDEEVLPVVLGERNAIKVAQFAGNDTSTTDNTTSTTAGAVVMKKYPPVATIEEFERELLALKSLTPNEYIVGLQGYISHPFSIVMEFVPGRNLYTMLHDLSWQKENSFSTRVSIALDIMKGLKHMHDKQYMHRDIKPHNILIEESEDGEYIRAKIADLGTAVKLAYPASVKRNDNQKSGHRIIMLSDVVGTSGYTAPEVLHPDGEGYSYPADIYSAAIVMWEILCQVNKESDFTSKLCNPLQGIEPSKVYGKMRSGLRPVMHPDYHNAHPTIHNLLISCWQTEAEYRMTFTEVCEGLEGLLEILEE